MTSSPLSADKQVLLTDPCEEETFSDVVSDHDDLCGGGTTDEEDPQRRRRFNQLNAKTWLQTGVKSLARKCHIVDDTDDGKTNPVQVLI